MDNTKTIRLFVSSTFSDFAREREILQTKVFPNIRDYASGLGYKFQPIDLRWGVTDEAQLDQKTLELCLNEVKECKGYLHPNFLIMIGDRYGWIPLPYAIEATEFESLTSVMTTENRKAVLAWYVLDKNQIPSSYILKKRYGKFEDPVIWNDVEKSLRNILQAAAEVSLLSGEERRKYFMSATDFEFEEGIISYKNAFISQKSLKEEKNNNKTVLNPNHIFGFFRNVTPNSAVAEKFISSDYEEAQRFKEKVLKELEENNILVANTEQKDDKSLEEAYLITFEQRVIEFLKFEINSQHSKSKPTSLEEELVSQLSFAESKRSDFLGLENARSEIKSYITSDNQQPLIIHGPSGCGKSSLMAKAIQDASDCEPRKIIYRFVSATPNSSSSIGVLNSICDELGIVMNSGKDGITSEGNYSSGYNWETTEKYNNFCEKICREIIGLTDDVVIFIDAVDQFVNDDNFAWLPEKLPKNVKIILSTICDENYPKDSRYLFTLKNKFESDSFLEIKKFVSHKQLLLTLLNKENRKIQGEQERYFEEQYRTAQSPLYVVFAVQVLKNWRSTYSSTSDSINANQIKNNLARTQQGIVVQFVRNITELHHHNVDFVNKVLCYIHASKYGLSENEILQLLSTDRCFIEKVAPEKFHINHQKDLPIIHWSRLKSHMHPFLSRRRLDGEDLICFFHREFDNCVETLLDTRTEYEEFIIATQKLITINQNKEYESVRWGKIYAILISDPAPHLTNETQQYLHFIIGISNLKWVESFLCDLNEKAAIATRWSNDEKAIAIQHKVVYILRELYKAQQSENAEHSFIKDAEQHENSGIAEYYYPGVDDLNAFLVRKLVEGLDDLAYRYRKAGKDRESLTYEKEITDIQRGFLSIDAMSFRLENELLKVSYWNNYRALELLDELLSMGVLFVNKPDKYFYYLEILVQTINDTIEEINSRDARQPLSETERNFKVDTIKYLLQRKIEESVVLHRKQHKVNVGKTEYYSRSLRMLIQHYEHDDNKELMPTIEIGNKPLKHYSKIYSALYSNNRTLAQVANSLGVGFTYDYLSKFKHEKSLRYFMHVRDRLIKELWSEYNSLQSFG